MRRFGGILGPHFKLDLVKKKINFVPSFVERLQPHLLKKFRRFARNRKSKLARIIDYWAVDFHRNFENWHYQFASNGEARVLECLRVEGGIQMIFDAGANQGDWSRMALEKFPEATIHAFELAPPVAAMLMTNVAGKAQIVPNACGLSEVNEEIEFSYAPNWNTMSSGIMVTGTTPTEKMRGRVVRGADYCKEKGIETIDFLKIDVEGMEHMVLRGFSEMLERKAIRVIQFEYGRVSIESHFLLKDFYTMLYGYGYAVGKIYPEEVLFKDYYYTDEDFLGPNYLAVQRSEAALIERFAHHSVVPPTR